MNKRIAFGNLVTLLRKLGATKYMAVPVVSNPYHLVDASEWINFGRLSR